MDGVPDKPARRRSWPSPLAMVVIFLCSFGFGRLTMSQTATVALESLAEVPIIGQMSHLIRSPDRLLGGEAEDRINILLLGVGGEGHEGPQLTDTIMVVSLRPSDGQVAVLSIPRDLIVPLPNVGWKKINAANAYGELSERGRGAELTRDTLEGLLGQPIPYYVRADFAGFKELIDGVGGVDVYIDKKFTDYTYPTADYGVRTVAFPQGWRHLDGDDALIFARSRHGTNGEGNDFARSRRQQKVLTALKDKLLDAQTYLNPAKINDTLAALSSNITTNIQLGEIIRLAKMARLVDMNRVIHVVLDNGPDSPLKDAYLGGAYVLVPKNDDWGSIRTLAADIFAEPGSAQAPPPPPPPLAVKPKVEILNATDVSGHARDAATDLAAAGLVVTRIGNAAETGLRTTVIYDLTDGARPEALETVGQAVRGAKLIKARSAFRGSPASADTDFVVMLGESSLPSD